MKGMKQFSGPAKKGGIRQNPALIAWVITVFVPFVLAFGLGALNHKGPEVWRKASPYTRALMLHMAAGVLRFLEHRAERGNNPRVQLVFHDAGVSCQAIGAYMLGDAVLAPKSDEKGAASDDKAAKKDAGKSNADGTVSKGLGAISPEEAAALHELLAAEAEALEREIASSTSTGALALEDADPEVMAFIADTQFDAETGELIAHYVE